MGFLFSVIIGYPQPITLEHYLFKTYKLNMEENRKDVLINVKVDNQDAITATEDLKRRYKQLTDQALEFDNINYDNATIQDLKEHLQQADQVMSDEFDFELSDIAGYDLWLIGSDNAIISDVISYHIKQLNCNVDYLNLIWENKYGGTTSHLFESPRLNKQAEKTTLINNKILSLNNGVYTGINKTINVHNTYNYSIHSGNLTDDEYKYVSDIIFSNNVNVVLQDGNLYPIQINNSNLDVNQKKYTKRPTQIQLQFTTEQEII